MSSRYIKIFISYEKGATINRIFAYANVLCNYFNTEVVMLSTEENDNNYEILDSRVQLSFVVWDGIVPSNFFSRFYKEFRLMLILSRELNGKEDTLITSIPFFSLLFLPFFRRNPSKKILDIRDLNWEYIPDKNIIMKLAKNIMAFTAKVVIKKYDEIIVTNSSEKKWVEINVGKKPILIHNGISREQFEKLKPAKNFVPNSEKTIISYIGNVGIAQNITSFIKIIKDYNDFIFRIVGDGNDLKNIEQYIQKNKVSNIELVGRVKFKDIPSYYNSSDILFAKLDPNYQTAVPSKLFEMLSTDKPIIYSGEGQSIKVLKAFSNIHIYKSNSELKKIIEHFRDEKINPATINNREKIEAGFIREDMILNNIKIF